MLGTIIHSKIICIYILYTRSTLILIVTTVYLKFSEFIAYANHNTITYIHYGLIVHYNVFTLKTSLIYNYQSRTQSQHFLRAREIRIPRAARKCWLWVQD